MPSVYSPTAVQLGNVTLPSDGDARSAATINVPLQSVADGVAFLNARVGTKVDEFTVSGTWTCPPAVTTVSVIGCGGGGGGGGGRCSGSTVAGSGGCGGGGALVGVFNISVTPGTVYSVAIGAGGAGGTGGPSNGNPGAPGGDGGDSTFNGITFYGAGGGQAAGPVSGQAYTPGAMNIRNGYLPSAIATLGEPPTEGRGGYGFASNVTDSAIHRGGGHSAVGRGGAAGAYFPPVVWGGGGGGASGWPGNAGGAGGAGTVGAGVAGSSGSMGAGGGGGGGGNGTNAGGTGGAGGSGRLRIIYEGVQAAIT